MPLGTRRPPAWAKLTSSAPARSASRWNHISVGGRLGAAQVPRTLVAQQRVTATVADHADERLDQGRVGHHAGFRRPHRAMAQVRLDEHLVRARIRRDKGCPISARACSTDCRSASAW